MNLLNQGVFDINEFINTRYNKVEAQLQLNKRLYDGAQALYNGIVFKINVDASTRLISFHKDASTLSDEQRAACDFIRAAARKKRIVIGNPDYHLQHVHIRDARTYDAGMFISEWAELFSTESENLIIC